MLIEVKATKSNRKADINFDMSANEYSVMNDNKSKYQIFYINNVYNAKEIERIKAKDIPKMIPSKYRASFNLK